MNIIKQGKTNWKYLGIVIFLALIATGAIFIYQKDMIQEMTTLLRFSEIKKCEEEIEDETADWKTYINEEFYVPYELKYPAYWNRSEYQIKEKLYASFSNRTEEEQIHQLDYCGINVTNSEIGYERSWSPPRIGWFETLEQITIDNMPAEKLIWREGERIQVISIFIQDKAIGLDLNIAPDANEDECINVFNQMLSTFRFIEEEPYIKVISPNGGERWVVGNTYDITWESRGFNRVFITLTNEELPGEWGQRYWICRLTSGYVSAKEGKYSWQVGAGECPVSPGNKFKIEVKEPEGMSRPRADDESDDYFSIISE